MSRPPVYIAAPYNAITEELRACNVARAQLLAQLAHRDGMAPVCMHANIHAGVYGDDRNAADRAIGIESTMMVVELVRRHSAGRLWVLETEPGLTSVGVTREIKTWKHGRPGGRRPGNNRGITRRGPWTAWGQFMLVRGLRSEWARLGDLHHRLSVQALELRLSAGR